MKGLLLLSLSLSLPLSGQQPVDNIGRVELPGAKGVLELNVGQTPWYVDFAPEDKWAMLSARQRPDNLHVAALLRQVTFAATPESCKAALWPAMQRSIADRIEGLHESSYRGAARLEYTFNGVQDTRSRHVLAYWGARDLCAEVHLSKVGFTPPDQRSLEQVLASVRLSPNESGLQTSPQENSSILMAQGSELHAQRKYGEAAKFYQRALDLERNSRTFDKDLFLDLIDSLAFCYRLNGNLAKAREVLDYGLSQESKYPLFHYNAACVYAEMGQLDNSLASLREAYRYRNNASSQLPADPTEDYCFRRFANDPQFRNTVQKIIRQ